MQSKPELDDWYTNPDPWGYRTNPDDILRRNIIREVLLPLAPFERALDIGCGEGFITSYLPAMKLDGIELSDTAAARLHPRIRRVHEPDGRYDLVVATGVLYAQYEWPLLTGWILSAAQNIVLTCHIKDWELNELPADRQVHVEEFPYREYTQVLRLYRW